MPALTHYCRLFSVKIADFLFAFSSKLKCRLLKLEVVSLVKLQSKGKVANLPLIE